MPAAAGTVVVFASDPVSLADNITAANVDTGNDYLIVIDADIPIDGSAALPAITGDISLTTNATASNTIYRTAANTSFETGMFTVLQGGSLTILNNTSTSLVLDGKRTSTSGNLQPLVMVNAGGRLILSGGSLIDNEAVFGGGVCVNAGNITMSGGSISGNIADGDGASSYGGGVYANASRITMIGGSISGNTANKTADTSYGGGVYLIYSNYTISGNARISGNTATSGGGVYVVNSTFEMDMNAEISDNIADHHGGGVRVFDNGTFVMKGGFISGNSIIGSGGGGGGVYMDSDNVFTFSGGSIISNSVTNYGGGVCMDGGIFTMTGGRISENIVTNANAEGVGVYVYGGTFSMSGNAEISDNNCASLSGIYGGGVYLEYYSMFTMTGGNITNNTATDYGGGVYMASSTFNMSGGNISHNNLSGSGGGVYMASDSFLRMSGGAKISENRAGGRGAGVRVYSGSTFIMDDGDITGNIASGTGASGGGVATSATFILSDGNITGNHAPTGGGVSVSGGTSAISGGNVSGNSATDRGGGVYMSSGTFSMNNTSQISGNTASTSGGGVYMSSGTFSMNNASQISGNTASTSGGGVYMTGSGARFTMNNTTQISGNSASTSGGGMFVSGGTLTMSNGNVSGNSAPSGGGMYVSGGTLTMSNGNVSGNSASTSGGGVYVNSPGVFNMTGGKISGNSASASGGEAYHSGSAFRISGNATITTNETYLTNGKFINVTTALINGGGVQNINVSNTTAGVVVVHLYNGAANSLLTNFTLTNSLNTSHKILSFSAGSPPTLVLADAAPVTYNLTVVNGTGSGAYSSGTVVSIDASTIPDKVFSYWTNTSGLIADVNSSSTTFTMPAGDATVTAVFIDAPPVTHNLTVVNGTGSGAYSSGTVVSIDASTIPDKVFLYWTNTSGLIADVNSSSTTFTMPAGDATVTAVFIDAPPVTYNLTVVNGTGEGHYVAGFNVTIAASTISGKVFDHWTATAGTLADASSPSTLFTMPAGDATVTAFFVDVPSDNYTLHVVNGSGTGPYPAGAIVPIVASTLPGYTFDQWTNTSGIIDNATSPSTTLTMPSDNVTVEALFSANPTPTPIPTPTPTTTIPTPTPPTPTPPTPTPTTPAPAPVSGDGYSSTVTSAISGIGDISFGTATGITGISFARGTAGSVTLDTEPSGLPVPDNCYVIADLSGPSSFTGLAEIRFSVPTAILQDQGLTTNDVVLKYYSGSTWTGMSTFFIGADRGAAHYVASAAALAPVAVVYQTSGAQTVEKSTPQPTSSSVSPDITTKTTPASTPVSVRETPVVTQSVATSTAAVTEPTLREAPVPAAGVLFGLLAAFLLLRRRE